MAWHLAESEQQAEQEAVDGLHHWHNESNVRVLGRPGSVYVAGNWEFLARVTGIGDAVGTSVIGTPDEMVKTIHALQEVTGGFGVVLGFAHDWANHEATLRSWELYHATSFPRLTDTPVTSRLRPSIWRQTRSS